MRPWPQPRSATGPAPSVRTISAKPAISARSTGWSSIAVGKVSAYRTAMLSYASRVVSREEGVVTVVDPRAARDHVSSRTRQVGLGGRGPGPDRVILGRAA